MTTLLQTLPVKTQGLGLYDAQHLGIYAGMTIDTVATPDEDMHKAWMPSAGFTKVPVDVCVAFHKLCVHYLGEDDRNPELLTGAKTLPTTARTLEVSVGLYRNYATGEIRGFVDPQVVSMAYIDARSADLTRPPIDILTGEKMAGWQDEWHEYGRFHSHNTMQARPSGTDNASELKTPGVYAIFGEYRVTKDGGYGFSIYSSVVTPYPGKDENIRRTHVIEHDDAGATTLRDIVWDDILVFDGDSNVTFATQVLENVLHEKPKEWINSEPTVIKSMGNVILGAAAWDDYATKRYTNQPSSDWQRFDEDIDAAMGLAGMSAVDQSACDWRIRTIMNTLDDCFAKVDDTQAFTAALSLVLSEFGYDLIDKTGYNASKFDEEDAEFLEDTDLEAYERDLADHYASMRED